MTTVRELVDRATDRLAQAGVPSPRVDAEELAAYALGVHRGQLPAVSGIDAERAERLHTLVSRREAREPLQHLIGSAPFRYLELVVGPGVFVPRPETELVAQAAIDEARCLGAGPLVVDLGTGSGAIALAVATEVAGSRVQAVEVDPVAHSYALRNIDRLPLGAAVSLHLADLRGALHELDGTVDVVVANPPYVPLTHAPRLDPEVREHDPAGAVFGGADGLDGPRLVVAAAARLLRPGGLLVMEHDDSHGESAPALLRRGVEWEDVADHRDLSGRPRYLTARRATTRTATPSGETVPRPDECA